MYSAIGTRAYGIGRGGPSSLGRCWLIFFFSSLVHFRRSSLSSIECGSRLFISHYSGKDNEDARCCYRRHRPSLSPPPTPHHQPHPLFHLGDSFERTERKIFGAEYLYVIYVCTQCIIWYSDLIYDVCSTNFTDFPF